MNDRGKLSVHGIASGGGITLREHFAAMALQGLLANANTGPAADKGNTAASAVAYADALLAALHPPK